MYFLFRVKGTIVVLDGFTLNPSRLHHWAVRFSAVCILLEITQSCFPLTKITTSSAKPITSKPFSDRLRRRSSTINDHYRGDNIPPWGHPFVVFLVRDVPPSLAVISRVISMVWIHFIVFLSMPCLSIAIFIELWDALSNAPSMSRKAAREISLAWMDFSIFPTNICSASVVDTLLL